MTVDIVWNLVHRFHAKVRKFHVRNRRRRRKDVLLNWNEFVTVVGFLPASILHAPENYLAYRCQAAIQDNDI